MVIRIILYLLVNPEFLKKPTVSEHPDRSKYSLVLTHGQVVKVEGAEINSCRLWDLHCLGSESSGGEVSLHRQKDTPMGLSLKVFHLCRLIGYEILLLP